MKKETSKNELISVRSLKPNVYYTDTRTFDSYEWLNVGDTNEMTYNQLKQMIHQHKAYFKNRWLILDDEEAMKTLKISHFYEERFTAKDWQLFSGDNVKAVKEKLALLSAEEKAGLLPNIRQKISSGKILNIHMIRFLENEYGESLLDLVP